MNLKDIKNKIPVERGCNNKNGCFCSGKCKEVVGYLVNGAFEPIKEDYSDIDRLKGKYRNNENDITPTYSGLGLLPD